MEKILPDYELRFWGNDCLDRFDNKYLRQAVEAKSGLLFPIMYACMLCWKKAVFTLTRMKKSSAGWTSLWNTTFYRFPTVRNGQGDFSGINRRGAAQRNHQNMLEVYDYTEFVNPDGSYNMTPNPKYFRKVLLEKYGIKIPMSKKDGFRFAKMLSSIPTRILHQQ